jgi:hypothetical protein
MISSRIMRRVRHVPGIVVTSGLYSFLMCKCERSKSLGKPIRRWEGNTKAYLQEIKRVDRLDSSGSRQGQDALSCGSSDKLPRLKKYGEFLD